MKKMLIALGLSSALLGGSVAWAEESATAPTEEVTVVDTANTTTLNTTEAAVPVEAAPAPAER